MNARKFTGHDAINFAENSGLTLSKFVDPIEDARDGLSIDEAREIAHEDPSLIWLAPPPSEDG